MALKIPSPSSLFQLLDLLKELAQQVRVHWRTGSAEWPRIQGSHFHQPVVPTVTESWRAGSPHLWDLMLDDKRHSWRNNNRNKEHSKCNALESSRNHSPPLRPWKNCLPWNQSLVPKRLGMADLEVPAKIWNIRRWNFPLGSHFQDTPQSR